MTSNQIAYANYVETVRNNKELNRLRDKEINESMRHNISTEYTANYSAQEQARHNRAGEYNAFATLQENIRHNKVSEEQQDAYQSELNRHNTVTEAQGWTQANSVAAMNYANANLANSNVGVAALQTQYNYELGLGNMQISQQNADTNTTNARTNWHNYELAKDKFTEATRQFNLDYQLRRRDTSTREKAQSAQEYQGWFNVANGFFNNVLRSGITSAIGG